MRKLFPYQRACSHVLIGVTLLALFFSIPLGIVHAGGGGSVVINIKPAFFPHPNARPRAYFIYDSIPTARIQDSLIVTNVGTVRGKIKLFPVDAFTSQSSGTAFTDPSVPQHDVGAWIKLSIGQVTLNPGQSQHISFSVTIPRHVRPGQHGGGILAEVPLQVQQQDPSPDSQQTIFHFQSENILGMLINLPGHLIEKMNMTGIVYDTAATYQRVLLALQNTGTQLAHPYGNLQIVDNTGKRIENEALKLDTFLPQTAINFPVFIRHKALSPGTYTARVHLNYEHNHSLNYVASFVVPILPQPKIVGIAGAISDLVSLKPEFLQALTPGEYIAGMAILLAVLWPLFFGSKHLYFYLAQWKRKRKGTANGRRSKS